MFPEDYVRTVTWIPVDEALPYVDRALGNFSNLVLVWPRGGVIEFDDDPEGDCYYGVGFFHADSGRFEDVDGDHWLPPVSHWMPMPPGPRVRPTMKDPDHRWS